MVEQLTPASRDPWFTWRKLTLGLTLSAAIVLGLLAAPVLYMMWTDSRHEQVPREEALGALRAATAGMPGGVPDSVEVVRAERYSSSNAGSDEWHLFRARTEHVIGLAAAVRELRTIGPDQLGWVWKRDVRRRPKDTSIHAGLSSVPSWWRPDRLTDAQAVEFSADGNFDLLILSPSAGQIYLLRSRM